MKYLRKKIKWKNCNKIKNFSLNPLSLSVLCWKCLFFLLCSSTNFQGIAYEINKDTVKVNYPCSQVLPYNSIQKESTGASCSWQCKENYFLTLPPNKTAGIPTCRKCSSIEHVVQQCKIGETVKNCTVTSNAQCVPCEEESSSEQYFVAGDCSRKKCRAGYTLGIGFSCVPCPEDFYCTEQEKNIFSTRAIQCPKNCTTRKKTRVYSSLGCNYPSYTVGNYLLLNLEYVASFSQTLLLNQKVVVPKNKRCLNLDKNVMDLLEFGTLEKCTITETYVKTIIDISCSIIISNCYDPNVYNAWLLEKLEISENSVNLERAMKMCILDNEKDVYDTYQSFVTVKKAGVSIVKTMNSSSTEIINMYQNNERGYNDHSTDPENAFHIYNERLPWWRNKSNALNVVGFFFVILSFLFIGILIMIFICCLVYYKYKFLKKIIK